MTQTAITGATLIDGNGGSPIPDAVVLFEGDRFVGAGARNGSTLPEGATQVDASGKFLIPGLINSNVHLLDAWTFMIGTGTVEYLARFEGRLHEVIEEAAQIALANGMTTVFDTYNALQPVLFARDRIASGEALGARIYAAGNIVGMGGPFSADFSKKARETSSQTFCDRMDAMFEAGVGRRLAALPPEEVRLIIRDYLSKGVDLLKFAISDHIVLEYMNPHLTFSARVQRVIAEETWAAGKPLLSHTTSLESLNDAVTLGVDAMMHTSMTAGVPIPDDIIEQIIKKTVWAEIQPVHDEYQHHLETSGGMMAGYAGGVHRENIQRLIAAGAPILLGTDAGCMDPDCLADMSEGDRHERPWSIGGDHFHWFRAMRQLGMKPMDMLQAATKNIARAYKKEADLGTVEAGKFADFLILDANPLDDEDNYKRIHAIYQGGRKVDRSALPVKRLVTEYPRCEPA
uniref:Napropamide amidohydrolase n=1 Tax=Sphingobium sp. B2 TaxID=2583228 RepID=A0A5P9NRP8_9SPHN|nr:napropamide amidohydrolase [Sphingobium sp. B2]